MSRDGASLISWIGIESKECFDWLSRQGQLMIGSQDAATVSLDLRRPSALTLASHLTITIGICLTKCWATATELLARPARGQTRHSRCISNLNMSLWNHCNWRQGSAVSYRRFSTMPIPHSTFHDASIFAPSLCLSLSAKQESGTWLTRHGH